MSEDLIEKLGDLVDVLDHVFKEIECLNNNFALFLDRAEDDHRWALNVRIINEPDEPVNVELQPVEDE